MTRLLMASIAMSLCASPTFAWERNSVFSRQRVVQVQKVQKVVQVQQVQKVVQVQKVQQVSYVQQVQVPLVQVQKVYPVYAQQSYAVQQSNYCAPAVVQQSYYCPPAAVVSSVMPYYASPVVQNPWGVSQVNNNERLERLEKSIAQMAEIQSQMQQQQLKTPVK